jgi:hypothetical protein
MYSTPAGGKRGQEVTRVVAADPHGRHGHSMRCKASHSLPVFRDAPSAEQSYGMLTAPPCVAKGSSKLRRLAQSP